MQEGILVISQKVTDSAEKLVTSKFFLCACARLDSTIRNLIHPFKRSGYIGFHCSFFVCGAAAIIVVVLAPPFEISNIHCLQLLLHNFRDWIVLKFLAGKNKVSPDTL